MTCKFSIIIPAFNEGDMINSTIESISELAYSESSEIIVVDGHPDKTTINQITSLNVKKVCCRKGRGNQLNSGVAVAAGDILIFLHADTRLPVLALKWILSALEDRRYAGGAFDLSIAAPGFAFRLIEKVASWRSRLTKIPYGDQAIFIRSDYFRALGGFQDVPIMEDVELMQRIKRRGGKIKIIPELVLTSPRRWQKEGVVFCTLRNWLLVSLFLLGVKPESLARFYS